MDHQVISIKRKAMVVPSTMKAEKEVCPLLTFDLPYVTFYYNQKLLVYKNIGSSDHEDRLEWEFEKMVEVLERSVGEVLGFYYPLAGRLRSSEDGVLEVGCDDRGAEFTVAYAEGFGVDELTKPDHASHLVAQLVPCTGIQNYEGTHLPLLCIQVTKLKDGIVVGCAFNHVVLDGTATWHFMESWAELARGEKNISTKPIHDRAQVRNTRVKLELPKRSTVQTTTEDVEKSNHHNTSVDVAKDSQENGTNMVEDHEKVTHQNGTNMVEDHEKVSHDQNGHDHVDQPVLPPQLRVKTFHFTEKAVEKIKSDTNANIPLGQKPFSTYQALGAHVWRAVIRARELPPEAYTVFTLFIDCRKRLEPPLPENYFGNLINGIYTVTACGMLLAQPPEYAAGLIQQVIDSHTAAAIDAKAAQFEKEPKLFNFKDAGINCVTVGSSPRFKVYDIDFGWGKPEMVRTGCNNRFDGMMNLYIGKEGGKSVDMDITLVPEVMEKLEKDEQFLVLNVDHE